MDINTILFSSDKIGPFVLFSTVEKTAEYLYYFVSMLSFRCLLFKLILLSLCLISSLSIANTCLEAYEHDVLNIQYKLWLEYKKNETKESNKIYKQIQSRISSSQVSDFYYLGSGMTETYLVKFKEGFSGIFKPFPEFWKKKSNNKTYGTNPKAEVLASLLSNFLGLTQVPVTVLKELNGMRGSLQLFIPKAESEINFLEEISTNEFSEMIVFDYLINNLDRRRDNYFNSDRGLVAIDHSQSFSTVKSTLSHHEIKTAIKSLSKNKIQKLQEMNKEQMLKLAENLITNEQLAALSDRLQFIQGIIVK